MTGTVRAAAVFLALLGPAIQLTWWRAEARVPRLVVEGDPIPQALGPYAVRVTSELEPDVLAMIEPDHYALRMYGRDETEVLLYAAFYAGRGAKDAHDPEICFPAQGWDVVGRGETRVPVGEAELTAQVMRAYHAGREELVLYWFQPAHRWPGRAWSESFLRFADNMRGAPQYAFVRLSTRMDGQGRELDELTRVASALAPHVRSALERR